MGSISAALRQPKMLWAAKFWRTGMEVRDVINIISPSFDYPSLSQGSIKPRFVHFGQCTKEGGRGDQWGPKFSWCSALPAGRPSIGLYHSRLFLTYVKSMSTRVNFLTKPVPGPFLKMHSVSIVTGFSLCRLKTWEFAPKDEKASSSHAWGGPGIQGNWVLLLFKLKLTITPWKQTKVLEFSLGFGSVNWYSCWDRGFVLLIRTSSSVERQRASRKLLATI